MNYFAGFKFIVLFLLVGFVFNTLAIDKPDTNWWVPLFEEGSILLQRGNLDGAEFQFRKILEKDNKIPEAHYGLGMVLNRRQPGSKEAEKELKTAIKLNKEFAEAYHQLAHVYRSRNKLKDSWKNLLKAVEKNPTLANAWLELGELHEEMVKDNEDIVNIYMNGLKNNPANPMLTKKFIDAALWFDREKVAVKVLKSVSQQRLRIPENLFQLARLYYKLEDYEKSLKTLDSLETEFPSFSQCRINLLRAKNYLALDNLDAFYETYKNAINNIKDSLDAATVFNDVCYIMRDKEYEDYQRTSLTQLPNFYWRFWRSRDPNLATRVNERIPEHYRRVAYARKHFRRYTKDPEKYENFYAMEHPFAIFNLTGTQLLKETFLPKALPIVRDLDDMGIIYVRHGEPDLKVTAPTGIPTFVDADKVNFELKTREFYSSPQLTVDGGGDTTLTMAVPSWDIPTQPVSTLRVPRAYMGETLLSPGYFNNMPMNISWKYQARVDRPEMIFHFKKYLAKVGWMMEAIPYNLAEREILGVEYHQLAMESFATAPNESFIANLSQEIKDETTETVKIAMIKETSDYKFQDAPLSFPIQLLTFKFRNNNNLVEMYYGMEGKKVALASTKKGYALNISKFVGLYDENWNEVRWLKRTDTLLVNQTPEQWQNFSGVDVARFAVQPGKYHYEIQLRDNVSGKLGVYRGELEVEDYWEDELKLSDIILSGAIKPAYNQRKFSKEDIAYTPHMFTPFDVGDTVGIYFELYNLKLNKSGETHFRITSTLQPAMEKGGSPAAAVKGFFRSVIGDSRGTLGTSYDYTGKERDEKIYLNFEIGDKKSGDYELVIEAQDLNSGASVNKKVRLTIE